MAPTDFHSTAACVITSCSFDIFLSFASGFGFAFTESYFSSNVVLEEQALKSEADINNRKLQKK